MIEDVKQHREEIRDYLMRLIEENIDDIEPSDSFSLVNAPDYIQHSNYHDPSSLDPNPSISPTSIPGLGTTAATTASDFGVDLTLQEQLGRANPYYARAMSVRCLFRASKIWSKDPWEIGRALSSALQKYRFTFEYIEIPGGHRCRLKSILPTEFFVVLVRLPLVDIYQAFGIELKEIGSGPFFRGDIKQGILKLMNSLL
jgi:hypothetical protein